MENLKFGVGYCRVSTDQQVEHGKSLEVQENTIYRYAMTKGIAITKIYQDKGISGKTIGNRPGLQQLLSELKYGYYVLFPSLSRMVRSTKEALEILQVIQEKNCFMVIIDKDIDTNNYIGKFTFDLMNAMNELEVAQVGDRVSHVLNDMSANGKLKTKPKYGMKDLGKGKGYTENEEQQRVIKYMKQLVEENPKITCSQIAKKLHEERYPPSGKKWYPNRIKIILSQNNIRNT